MRKEQLVKLKILSKGEIKPYQWTIESTMGDLLAKYLPYYEGGEAQYKYGIAKDEAFFKGDADYEIIINKIS
jgi:hypothetical protein